MKPDWSKQFLRNLNLVGVLWLGIGIACTFQNPEAMSAFFQVYFFTALDLITLILLFWTLFFSNSTRRNKALRAVFFFTFKLVCLGLLAITLKRLRNAPPLAILLGVLFMGVGPLLAGVLSRIRKGSEDSESKF